MDFYYVNSLNDLTKGYMGILEPDIINKALLPVDEYSGLCIVPGVAFDKNCNRIGYGKGFYDRFFSVYKIKNVGLAFECQIVDKIQSEENDFSLDLVITEENKYDNLQ